MNDGTNIASDDIILKPKFRYWLMKNFLLITLAIFVFIFSKYIREHELLKFISGTILVLLIFIIFYRYISMLLCTKWIITREQIKIYWKFQCNCPLESNLNCPPLNFPQK